MAYDHESKGSMDRLCLYGALAQDFMRTHVGETVKLTVTGILNKVSIGDPDSAGGEETPCVEFEVLEAEFHKGKNYGNMSTAEMESEINNFKYGKKGYEDMSAAEMESQIHNVKYEDQPEPPTTIPNREDGGSIWTDIKRQEKIGRTPQRRPKPFRIG